jgi:hypothetical protein
MPGGVRRIVARGGHLLSRRYIPVVLALALTASAAGAAAGAPPSKRVLGAKLRTGQGLHPSATGPVGNAVPIATATIVTVDTKAFSGFENAIYAANRDRVVVAYKRFIRQPAGTNGEVVPARLCIARSIDGGATWHTQVVDPDAGDVGDTIDDSVAIGGAGPAVYVAYLAEHSEDYADRKLRLAKSADGGRTWTTRTIATGGVGEFTSIDVVDADHVLVATNWERFPASTVRLYSTDDGGATWSRSTVEDFGWYTGVDSTPTGTIWLTYYHPGDTDLYTATGPGPAGPWSSAVVAGAPADGQYTGIGASIAVSGSGAVFVSYEEFGNGTDDVKVRSSPDGGTTWGTSDLGPGGYDTGSEVRRDKATGRLGVSVAYWYVQPSHPIRGRVRIGQSPDGGKTWTVTVLPEPTFVAPYLDISAPTSDVRFVSYQTEDQTTHATSLRVARVTG